MGLDAINFSASTALVTGGSSGIGRAIAEELVACGVRQLIVVAKDEAKLSQAAKEIQSLKPGVEVRTIQANLTTHDASKNIQKEVQEFGWTVDILVNNAGFGRKYNFAEDPENDTSLACVDLMVRAVVEMSLLFLPGMKERRKGGILNIGSTACYQPVPYTAMYAVDWVASQLNMQRLEIAERKQCYREKLRGGLQRTSPQQMLAVSFDNRNFCHLQDLQRAQVLQVCEGYDVGSCDFEARVNPNYKTLEALELSKGLKYAVVDVRVPVTRAVPQEDLELL